MDKVQSSQSSLRETRSITESSLTSLNGDPPIRQLNQYLLTDILGSGSYGTVHLAREVDQPNSQYAIKELSKSRLAKLNNNPFKKSPQANNAGKLDCVKKEIAILKKVIHPYIVRLFEVLDDPSVDSLFMVFELLGSPIQQVSLYEPYDPLPIEKAQKYFQQLVLGIEFLHSNNIVHRDIKPDNILKTGSDSIKLVDFGVSEMFISSDDTLRGSKTSTTSAFLAPELISSLSNVSGKSADIWAMGVTLYSMIFGKLPFKGRGLAELYENIKNKEIELPSLSYSYPRDLLQGLLQKDADERITLNYIRNHAWVNQGAFPSREENLLNALTDPSQQEIDSSITTVNSVWTVLKAAHKFKKTNKKSPLTQ